MREDRADQIALIVPCYNGARYVPELLSSIERQTVKPARVLFIDDGSTDDSASIISGHEGVTLLRHEHNRGLAAARNTAIAEADQSVLLFVDSDTVLPDDFVSRCRALYRLYPDVAGIGGQAIEACQESIFDTWRRLHMSQSFGPEILKPAPMLWGVCSSYRRDVLDSIGRFNLEFSCNAEDVDIGFRLNDNGHCLLYHPGLSVQHRKSDTRDTLEKTLYRWFYWGGRAHRRNGRYPLVGLLRTVVRQTRRTFTAAERSSELRTLEIALLPARLRAISDACRPLSPATPSV